VRAQTALINTGLQPGEEVLSEGKNRFNGLFITNESVETLLNGSAQQCTPLKRGASETVLALGL
jgi:hypothetical protein